VSGPRIASTISVLQNTLWTETKPPQTRVNELEGMRASMPYEAKHAQEIIYRMTKDEVNRSARTVAQCRPDSAVSAQGAPSVATTESMRIFY